MGQTTILSTSRHTTVIIVHGVCQNSYFKGKIVHCVGVVINVFTNSIFATNEKYVTIVTK